MGGGGSVGGGSVGGGSVGSGTGVSVGGSDSTAVAVIVTITMAVFVGGRLVGIGVAWLLCSDRVLVGNTAIKVFVIVEEGVREGVIAAVRVNVGPVTSIAATSGAVDVGLGVSAKDGKGVGEKKRMANACWVRLRSRGVGVAVTRAERTTSL